MPKVEMDMETTVEPEAVRGALLDFTERRPEIWPGIEPSLYEVIRIGDTWAEIQEGSRMPGARIWAKERYDWSTPGLITWTVQESNFCTPGSFVSAEIAALPGGGSLIHVTWNRTPTTFIGRVAAFMIVATRGRPVRASLEAGLKRVQQAQAANADRAGSLRADQS